MRQEKSPSFPQYYYNNRIKTKTKNARKNVKARVPQRLVGHSRTLCGLLFVNPGTGFMSNIRTSETRFENPKLTDPTACFIIVLES